MDGPTVTEFADFIGISQPNATYKVNSLVQKGYIEKFSEGDKRKTLLRVSGKFRSYYPETMSTFKKAARMLREKPETVSVSLHRFRIAFLRGK